MFEINDIVVFRENHKWGGCIGFIDEIKNDRIMIGIPVPMQGIAYIFTTKEEIEKTNKYPYKV